MNENNLPVPFPPINQILEEIEKLSKDKETQMAIEKVVELGSKINSKINSNPILSTLYAIKTGPVGGAISRYLSGKGFEKRYERMEQLALSIKQSLTEEVNKKIEIQYLESDEFYYIFERILEKVIKTHSAEKIKRFSNIFINSCMSDLSKSNIKDSVISVVDSLSDDHINVLQYFFIQYDKLPQGQAGYFHILLPQMFDSFPQYHHWQLELFCNDLINAGLLYDYRIGKAAGDHSQYGLRTFAFEFRKFISDPNNKE